MHLSRWLSITSIAITFTACTDNLAPAAIAGAYGLHDINGRPVPTYEAATPGATRTINTASVGLDFGGTADLIQDITEFGGTRDTVTTRYTYRIKGHDLIFAFSPPCPPNASCISPPTGTITSSGDLELDMGNSDLPIIYHFQRITIGY
jgi:hypothetical protein